MDSGAIDGRLALGLLLILVVAKMLALSFTVSSGGSGGIFAPSLFVGAMLGGVLAALAHVPPAGLVIVGMAAVFAGAAPGPHRDLTDGSKWQAVTSSLFPPD